MRRIRCKHILLVLSIFIPIVFLFSVPYEASAGIVTDVVTGSIRLLTNITIYIIGIFLSFAGAFVDWMMSLNSSILDENTNAFIFTGWKILRDITNLGFVLVIIAIAFATIIGRKQYGAQALLPKLIAAAILVNFSLLIAGVFIDFSNTLTNFFLERSGVGNSFSTNIATQFAPQKILLGQIDIPITPPPIQDDVGGLGGFSASVLSSISGLVFGIVFMLLATIVMMGLGVMLLVRYVALTILLVVVPIIWLFWVIPSLSSHYNKWWSEFLKWVFFSPTVTFFFYLALVSAAQLNQGSSRIQNLGLSGALGDVLTQGGQMVALSGLLVGGLIAAEKMSITGASAAMKAARGVGDGTKKWAGNKVLRGSALVGKGFSKVAVATPVASAVESAGDALKSFGSKSAKSGGWYNLAKFTGAGRVARGAGKVFKGASDAMVDSARSDLPKSASLIGSTVGGAKKGSGLFKPKRTVTEWECSNCGNPVRSVKKPNDNRKCDSCGGYSKIDPATNPKPITWEKTDESTTT
jgi:hypothetical protein